MSAVEVIEPGEVERRIREAIPDCEVSAVNLHDSADHFEVTVVAEAFNGCSIVEQHRMVYAALGDAMRAAIHALVVKTLTPEQYRRGLLSEIE